MKEYDYNTEMNKLIEKIYNSRIETMNKVINSGFYQYVSKTEEEILIEKNDHLKNKLLESENFVKKLKKELDEEKNKIFIL